VDTPFGPIAAPDLADGCPVEILIRPEGLHIHLGAEGTEDGEKAAGEIAGGENGRVSGRVEAARLLGRTSLIHLTVEDKTGGDLHMHARMPGQFLPAEQSHVTISLDPRQAFVFPSGGTI
jgi:iron(III) transport system ATP-binding protein